MFGYRSKQKILFFKKIQKFDKTKHTNDCGVTNFEFRAYVKYAPFKHNSTNG